MARVPEKVEDHESLHRMLLMNGNAVRDGSIHYMAFYSSTYPFRLSVDRAEYRSMDQSLEEWGPQNGVGRLIAGTVRTVDLAPPLEVESVPERGNDAHAEIVADERMYTKNRMKTQGVSPSS